MGELSSSSGSLPVPSPDKGGGFTSEASNLLVVKTINAPRTNNVASDRIDQSDNDMARKRRKRLRKLNILRIGCWNVTSFNKKDQEILIEIKRHKVDICALSETKKKGKGNIKYEDYIFIYSGKGKHERATSGVGLMVHGKLEANIENVIYVNDRILQAIFKFQDTSITHIISVYAPDISKPSEEKDAFYEDLQRVLDGIPGKDEIMLLGDFNARVGNGVIRGLKNRFNEENINENGEQLIQTCAQNELRINNTFFPHKPQHSFTFENSRGQKSVIDYVITNKNVHPSKILDVRVLSSANTITNHNLVLAKIRNKVQRERRTQAIQTEKLNIESLSNDSTKDLYQRRLALQINNNKIREADDVESAWKKLRTNIITAAEEALGRRRTTSNGKRQTKPWFTEDVKTLAEEKRTAYLQFRSKKLTCEGYKLVRNRVNEQIQAIKRSFWEKFSSDMEHDLYGAQKKVWNMLRNRKKPVNEHIQMTRISSDTWEKHFHQLYGKTNKVVCEYGDVEEHGNWSISQEKIRQTLNALKK
ncbi:craniofacial development protein 2-like [Harmonia axyridis]|uniref:craniofacial development protein 2-like n=1 Tax=Harmonia axyridis TaxID=115357 RepID=UPI001E2794BE|nr:craniofacial development protein 2-like [Harmonia axyridis]